MSRIVQEKFEVHSTPNRSDDASNGWRSDASVRTRKGLQTRAAADGRYESYTGDSLNRLPPGTNIDAQEHADIRELARAGQMGTASQVTEDVTAEAVKKGYAAKSLRPTDDMYTREHNDAFYDTVEVEGVEGYVERNNYLDRL